MRSLPLALLAAAALAGCGSDEREAAAPPPAAATELTVEVTGAGRDPQQLELRCGAADPCDRAQLDELADVVKPPDPGRACTELYGGPEEAHITGTLEGRRVDVTVTRTNGCGIADYEALFDALGRKPIVGR